MSSESQDGSAPSSPKSNITPKTLEHAEKLAGVNFTDAERKVIAQDIHRTVQQFDARRSFELANEVSPVGVFDPVVRPVDQPTLPSQLVRSEGKPGALPTSDVDIAFAPVTHLSHWIEAKQLTSERLTRIYLDRLRKHDKQLECVITLTEELALRQAKQADREIAAGKYRGPLHGIPYGAKDLFDTAGIRTTWGATPFKDRVARTDATVVRKLEEAGAVLVAKTTLGALAYGDIWFGGKTKSPWNLERGSSGSSAGSASATAAGLMAFSLGTETYGSIISPSMRCGTTGLRPTFGRVSRAGAMALCWSLDKVGPITRTVEDSALVLDAILGFDPADPATQSHPFAFDANQPVAGMKVGYDPRWFAERYTSKMDQDAFEVIKSLGVELVEITLPDWPYDSLQTILMVEAAAAFEELTLTNRDDELVWQDPPAWPNSFRKTWFTPAIELLQAQRLRRRVCEMMAEKFSGLDAMIGPSFSGPMILITNHTGHPCLTLRTGFSDKNEPHGISVWGNVFDEGAVLRLGMELERRFSVWDQRPPLFG